MPKRASIIEKKHSDTWHLREGFVNMGASVNKGMKTGGGYQQYRCPACKKNIHNGTKGIVRHVESNGECRPTTEEGTTKKRQLQSSWKEEERARQQRKLAADTTINRISEYMSEGNVGTYDKAVEALIMAYVMNNISFTVLESPHMNQALINFIQYSKNDVNWLNTMKGGLPSRRTIMDKVLPAIVQSSKVRVMTCLESVRPCRS